jgi:NAD(P)-dependent dehydrogenase (short-subunit alcohol dehydrogenase family)
MPPLSLKDANVLVTGGSRGLGAVICEKFAAEGANLVINYQSSQKAADELASKLKEKYGVKVVALQAVSSWSLCLIYVPRVSID